MNANTFEVEHNQGVVEQETENCPRCGLAHHLTFRRLTTPIAANGRAFNWWASCPVNGQPVVGGELEGEE